MILGVVTVSCGSVRRKIPRRIISVAAGCDLVRGGAERQILTAAAQINPAVAVAVVAVIFCPATAGSCRLDSR